MSTLYGPTAFPGVDEDPLSEGGKWSGDAVNGAIRLVSNAIATHSPDTDSASRISGIATPNANHWCRFKYATLGSSNSDGGPAVRMDALGNHYFLTHFSGQMHLFRLRGGGATYEERTGGGFPITTGMATNDVWELQVTGTGAATVLTLLKNGVSQGAFTDSDGNALAAGGTFGVHMFDGGLRGDDVEAGDFLTGDVLQAQACF